jgi:hypothetical protein
MSVELRSALTAASSRLEQRHYEVGEARRGVGTGNPSITCSNKRGASWVTSGLWHISGSVLIIGADLVSA